MKDLVLEDAKKYKTKNAWRDNSPKMHADASKHNWMEEACAHMPPDDWHIFYEQYVPSTHEELVKRYVRLREAIKSVMDSY